MQRGKLIHSREERMLTPHSRIKLALNSLDIPGGKTSACWKALWELGNKGSIPLRVSTHRALSCQRSSSDSLPGPRHRLPRGCDSISSSSACPLASLTPTLYLPQLRVHFHHPTQPAASATGKSLSRNTCGADVSECSWISRIKPKCVVTQS